MRQCGKTNKQSNGLNSLTLKNIKLAGRNAVQYNAKKERGERMAKELMLNEAVDFLESHGYSRTKQWLKMMTAAGKIERVKREGRNFYSIAELKKVIKEKRKLKVSVC